MTGHPRAGRRAASPGTADLTTREAILEVALDLFATQGYAATSVRALTRAIGLRESSLYNHFEGKEAILTALVNLNGPARSAQRLSSTRYKALADDPEGFCRTHAADVLEQWADPQEQKFQHLLFAERQRLENERGLFAKSWFQDEVGAMEAYFRGFAAKGLIKAPDPRETARLFMAGLTFIRMEYFVLPAVPAAVEAVRPQLDRYLVNFLATVVVKPPRGNLKSSRIP